MTLRRFVASAVAMLIAAAPALAGPPPLYAEGGPGWWRIDPKSTFYRTNNDPKATSSFFFILAELPFGSPSAPLTIEVYGDYRPNVATGDVKNVLHGVFTKTPTILASNLQNRLPDAVLASQSTTSGPTYHGSLPTEIQGDFRIIPDATGKYTIPVPAGAQWIAVCICDSYYSDNDDPDDDLYIRFRRQ